MYFSHFIIYIIICCTTPNPIPFIYFALFLIYFEKKTKQTKKEENGAVSQT